MWFPKTWSSALLTSNKYPNVLNEIFLLLNISAGLCPSSSCVSYDVILNIKMDWIKNLIKIVPMWKLLTPFSPHFDCFESFPLHISLKMREIWTHELSGVFSIPYWACGVWISLPQIANLWDLQMTTSVGERRMFPHTHQQRELFLPELLTSIFNTETNVIKSQMFIGNIET